MHYNKAILHYLHLDQRIGTLDETVPGVQSMHLHHPASLTRCALTILMEQDVISKVKFKVYGCGVTIACMAWVAEFLENKTKTEAKMLTTLAIIEALDIPKPKQHCAKMIYEMITL